MSSLWKGALLALSQVWAGPLLKIRLRPSRSGAISFYLKEIRCVICDCSGKPRRGDGGVPVAR